MTHTSKAQSEDRLSKKKLDSYFKKLLKESHSSFGTQKGRSALILTKAIIPSRQSFDQVKPLKGRKRSSTAKAFLSKSSRSFEVKKNYRLLSARTQSQSSAVDAQKTGKQVATATKRSSRSSIQK